MKNYVSKFAVFVALCTGMALAQGTPQSSQPSSSSPSASSPSQSQEQTPSATQPDQSKGDQGAAKSSDMPKADQDKDKDRDQSKLPQSDNAAAASTGDVATQIQSALQQDPKLASDNITAKVNGNKLELEGTVQSADEKKQAEKIAKDKAGSLKVKNHIKVASNNMGDQNKSKDNGANPPKQ
jgi:osmotically-inducible protein OsmY